MGMTEDEHELLHDVVDRARRVTRLWEAGDANVRVAAAELATAARELMGEFETVKPLRSSNCPHCHSYMIEGDSWDNDDKEAYQDVACNECESRWTDVYRLDRRILHEEGEDAAPSKREPVGMVVAADDPHLRDGGTFHCATCKGKMDVGDPLYFWSVDDGLEYCSKDCAAKGEKEC